jgi:hypothetical protein
LSLPWLVFWLLLLHDLTFWHCLLMLFSTPDNSCQSAGSICTHLFVGNDDSWSAAATHGFCG